MTIVDLVRILRRNLLWIVLGALIGVMLAGAYVITRPTVYTAQATGVVVAGDSLSVGDTITANSVTVQRAAMYARLANTSQVATRSSQILQQQGMAGVRGGVSAVPGDGSTPFIVVTATSDTAKGAQALANATLLGIRSEALRLETFGKTQGRQTSETELERLTNIHVLTYQPAGVPPSPSKPNLVRNLVAGALLGAIIAGALSIMRRAFDAKVRTQQDVETLTGKSALAIVPDSKSLKRTGKPTVVGGPAGEAIRQLRTNLRFVSVDEPPRSIVVTSPTPGDGKSTIASHLARLMAVAGEQVVLIDCDLRLPSQGDQFGIDGSVGLTQVVAGDLDLDDVLVDSGVPGLQLLPAGRIPPNPSELLGSRTMQALVDRLSENHIVILDAPPALAVTDAALVGSLADGVIIVTRMGATHKAQLEQCAKLLTQANATLLGVVLNRASLKTMGDVMYGYGYGYGSYGNHEKYQEYYGQEVKAAEAAVDDDNDSDGPPRVEPTRRGRRGGGSTKAGAR